MIVLLVHPAANPYHNDHVGQHEQVEPDRWNGGLNDDFTEVPNEQIHRVQKEQIPYHGFVPVDGVENGRHIHQQHGKHRPEILDIPEEHKQSRQYQPHTDVKQH